MGSVGLLMRVLTLVSQLGVVWWLIGCSAVCEASGRVMYVLVLALSVVMVAVLFGSSVRARSLLCIARSHPHSRGTAPHPPALIMFLVAKIRIHLRLVIEHVFVLLPAAKRTLTCLPARFPSLINLPSKWWLFSASRYTKLSRLLLILIL